MIIEFTKNYKCDYKKAIRTRVKTIVQKDIDQYLIKYFKEIVKKIKSENDLDTFFVNNYDFHIGDKFGLKVKSYLKSRLNNRIRTINNQIIERSIKDRFLKLELMEEKEARRLKREENKLKREQKKLENLGKIS